MYRNLLRLRPFAFGSLIPLKIDQKDGEYKSKYEVMDYDEFNSRQSGIERLRLMFSVDEFENLSKELSSVFQSCFFGTFMGACYGGFVRSRVSYMDFIEHNQATSFYSNFDAKKKLQHQVTMGFARGALQWGWRLGFFVGAYTFLSTAISVYRGKSSMVEYMTAGAVTGSIYKMTHGLRGIIVGGGLGLILGCFGGGISLAALNLTGKNMDEVRFWQHQWKSKRHQYFEKALDKTSAEKYDPLVMNHDLHLENIGEKLTKAGIKDNESSPNEIKNL